MTIKTTRMHIHARTLVSINILKFISKDLTLVVPGSNSFRRPLAVTKSRSSEVQPRSTIGRAQSELEMCPANYSSHVVAVRLPPLLMLSRHAERRRFIDANRRTCSMHKTKRVNCTSDSLICPEVAPRFLNSQIVHLSF